MDQISADNWARCPRCLKQGEVAFANLTIQVDSSYGKVPVEEFDRKRAALAREQEKLESDDTFRTFREDYEFYGAETGVLEVSYQGQCTTCHLKMELKESHKIPGL